MAPEAKFRVLEIHCSKFGDLSDTNCQVQGSLVNFSLKKRASYEASIGQHLHVSFLGSCSLQIYAINEVDELPIRRFTHELTGLQI
jgi:hypothetical protein